MSTDKPKDLPDRELLPIDPDYVPTKTLAQISAEHPEWAGLRQLVESQQWAMAECTARRAGINVETKH